ncbi:MAG: hypothetical protein ACOVKC_08810 [Brevundimonas sp.]
MPLDLNTANIQTNSLVSPQFPVALTGVATAIHSSYLDNCTHTVEMLPASGAAISTYAPRGMRLTSVKAVCRASIAATELQLYVADSTGATKRFINSTLMAAYTVSQATGQTEIDLGFSESNPLILSAGERLYCGIGVALTAGVVFRAEGGGY